MSKNFNKVKIYYDEYVVSDGQYGWSKERVKAVVGKWITPEEYTEITGEPYEG